MFVTTEIHKVLRRSHQTCTLKTESDHNDNFVLTGDAKCCFYWGWCYVQWSVLGGVTSGDKVGIMKNLGLRCTRSV